MRTCGEPACPLNNATHVRRLFQYYDLDRRHGEQNREDVGNGNNCLRFLCVNVLYSWATLILYESDYLGLGGMVLLMYQ